MAAPGLFCVNVKIIRLSDTSRRAHTSMTYGANVLHQYSTVGARLLIGVCSMVQTMYFISLFGAVNIDCDGDRGRKRNTKYRNKDNLERCVVHRCELALRQRLSTQGGVRATAMWPNPQP